MLVIESSIPSESGARISVLVGERSTIFSTAWASCSSSSKFELKVTFLTLALFELAESVRARAEVGLLLPLIEIDESFPEEEVIEPIT